MALEFNADKERIVSSNLEIRNATSFNQILGSGGNQKSALYGQLTADVDALVRVGINTEAPEFELDVNGQIRTTTSIISDTARINNLDIDTIVNPFLNILAPNLVTFTDPDTGVTSFPTSATPAFNDDSEKIATTNFVYNIATNDVGGRIYVSQQIGDDTFDGRSATKPVRSIKRAAQLASLTDDKETLIVAGGEYLEDNPISLPSKCSVVGDNIRLCIVRPQNPGKHMFKAASENYIFGITFRDQIDIDGNAVATWDFAYVFDDKQRIFYDKNLGGEFGRNLPVGYQFFGPSKFLVTFSELSPVLGLEVGITVTSSSGGSATVTEVTFEPDSTIRGTFLIENVSGAFAKDDVITYDDSGTQRTLNADELTSQRVEGEVVKHVTDHDQYVILSIEASDDYPDGLIFEINQYHNYEVGQYVDIANLPNSGIWADLNRFNGRQRISHRIETTDGFSTKFVVYKDVPTDILSINAGGSPVYTPSNSTVESSDNYTILSLLNSPFKFESATPNAFRYQDAVDLIQRNKTFIAEEALGYVQALYPGTSFDTIKCKRDIEHIINHVSHDLFYGGNSATIEAGAAYLEGGQIGFVNNELAETRYGFEKTRDLCILAARNWNTGTGAYSEADYTPLYSSTSLYQDPTIIEDTTTPTCANVVSSITTLFQIVDDILNGNALPASTYPTSYITDQDGKVISVIDPYDDLPIIEVSPYIFNSSVISFLGGGGCLIDGTKVATPNVARPNIPEQGKSMVAAAFTIISFGGTGYRVIEDGYCQLVSCFVIFCQDGILAETGGYASVTNSATNFGTYALRATGYRREPYSFNRGTIENITFDEVGIPTFEINSLQGQPLEHYVIKIGGVENEIPTEEYFIDDVVSVSAGPPFTVEVKIDAAMDIIGNNNRFNDAYNLLYNNAEYIGDEAVDIIRNYTTLATAYGSGNEYEVGDIVSFQGNYYICVRYLSSSPITLNADGQIFFQEIVSSTDNIVFQSDIEKCRRDTKLMTQAWATDLLQDANANTWDAAKLYIDGTSGGVVHITGYEDATKAVFNVASVLAKLAINNLLRKSGVTLTSQEEQNGNYVAQYTTLTPYRDLTIVNSNDDGDTNNYTTGDCVDVKNAIDSLYGLVVEILNENEVVAGLTRDDGVFRLNVLNRAKLIGKDIAFHRPSIVNSSSHTWEYAGSGNNYNALPQNGGQTGSTNTQDFEQVSESYGRVYSSGTDELGDFKVGYFAKVENRTGNITFGGTVEISEVSFLRISGGDIVVTGFSADNTLGGIFSSDSLLPTQRAVKDYISNNLGNFINKSYSTNPTPRALVELGDNGRINIDQLPALRPFNVFTVADLSERLALQGPLAGDIAIQQDNSLSYILNNDLEFQILKFAQDDDYVFNVNDVITATPSTSQATVTTYIHGYIDTIFVSDPGVNYTSAPTVSIGDTWTVSTSYFADDQIKVSNNLYTITNTVTLTGSGTSPSHTTGVATSDGIQYTHVGTTWATATNYGVGTIVNNSGNVYLITEADGASTTGPSGTAIRQHETIGLYTYQYLGGAWSNTGTYGAGDYVGANGEAYKTDIPVTSGTTSPTHTSGTVTIDGVDYKYAGTPATATVTISNGRVSSVNLTSVGDGYLSNPSVNFDNTGTNGSGAQATAIVRSKLYITIENNIKVNSGDTIEDFTSPYPYNITILDAVNTSAQNENNWVQLTSSNIDAAFITSGVINTARLATPDTNFPANSTTFLRGDQKYAPVVQSLRTYDDETPIVLASNFTRASYIDQVRIDDGGNGYAPGTYTDQNLFGGGGTGAKANIVVSNGSVKTITITNSGGGYVEEPTVSFKDSGGNLLSNIKAVATVSGGIVTDIQILDGGSGLSTAPTIEITDESGSGASAAATATIDNGVISRITITDGGINYGADYNITPLPSAITSTQSGGSDVADLQAILATRDLNFATVDIDIRRVDGNTPDSTAYSTVGVARFRKSDINGTRTGQFRFDPNGGVYIDQGTGSGLDADKLDGQQGNYYRNGENFIDFTITPTKLSNDTYDISVQGSAGTAGLLEVTDTRTINTQPQATATGLQLAWKQNTSSDGANSSLILPNDEVEQALNDGGTLHSQLIIRRSGATPTDFSGGAINSLAFTDNNNLYVRGSGANYISALTIIDGGNGYIPGTYTNIPLGGGEGSGLTANITVNNSGIISNVQLVNTGHNYDRFGSAGTQFIVDLPENYLGLDNGRTRYTAWQANQTYNVGEIYYVGNTGARGFIYEVVTAGTSGNDPIDPPQHESGDATATGGTAVFRFTGYTNARIQATIATTTSGNWESWQEVWHEGNDGPNSGLNADKLDGRHLDWVLRADNTNKGTIGNRRIPDNLTGKNFTNFLKVNVPDPSQQSAFSGPFYDFYLEGFINTNELGDLDTLTGAGLQLNLYTETNVNKGTVQVIEINVNSEEADLYWSANTSIPFNRLVQYGYNIYRTDAAISDTGTTPPTHPNGTQNNFEFIEKVNNPFTIVTAELITGTLDYEVFKLGTAVRPATYYTIHDWGTNKDPKFDIQKHELTVDGSSNPIYRLGNDTQISSPKIVFNSSGQNNNYDVRLNISGGTSTDGEGTFNIQANSAQVNGNIIWHGGNVSFGTGSSGTAPALTYDTGANGKAVLRTADGDFGGRYIVASSGFIGTATGNLALTGGTLTGNITFTNDQLGLVWSRNTDGASIKFYNTGDGDTNSRLEFQTNDNANEYFRWTHARSGVTPEWESMRLTPNANKGAELRVNGYLNCGTDVRTAAYAPLTVRIASGNAPQSGAQNFFATMVLEKRSDTWNRLRFDREGVAEWGVASDPSSRFAISRLSSAFTGTPDDDNFVIKTNGFVGIQTNDPQYQLQVNGTFAATSKSFVIDHPTKKDYRLVYGSLEGPEHGVYVRGKVTDGVIELPDYWTALVDEDTITVQLTAIGDSDNRWVIDVADNKITTGGGAAFYFVQAERKDIDKLEVEVEVEVQ